jgi:uncharacterized damage-inducible protein DinB
MSIPHLIAQHITEVYEGDNWTGVSITDAIKDVNWQQAQQKTIASSNTVAALLHHIYYWNGIMMQRVNGINPSIPDTNGFDVDELKNENDWNDLKEKTHQSFIALANAVKNFPEEKLDEISPTGRSSYYKNLQGIVEHAHYHLGQIVIIKKLLTATSPA